MIATNDSAMVDRRWSVCKRPKDCDENTGRGNGEKVSEQDRINATGLDEQTQVDADFVETECMLARLSE